jgi:dephospho-CoA kinase
MGMLVGDMAVVVFGLTGGIGSGKSTVAARLRERGVPVIDADVLAREVVARGTPGLAEIRARFGDAVMGADGELDRKQLAAVVFADEDARRALNAITHPRVRDLALARVQELDARGEPLVCYEVPLLVESGLADALRPLVVVVVDRETQVERTMGRDGCTREEAEARIRAQIPLAEKAALADHVIDNSGSLAETRARVDAVLEAICLERGVAAGRYPRPA